MAFNSLCKLPSLSSVSYDCSQKSESRAARKLPCFPTAEPTHPEIDREARGQSSPLRSALQ